LGQRKTRTERRRPDLWQAWLDKTKQKKDETET
jgi:tRNA G37 N-methylase TrmD